MSKPTEGCVKPARGPLVANEGTGEAAVATRQEVVHMQAKVGHPAPDFEATAYVGEKGFAPVKLSDYKGKWIVLCFYPGDFTFV